MQDIFFTDCNDGTKLMLNLRKRVPNGSIHLAYLIDIPPERLQTLIIALMESGIPLGDD